MKTITNKSIELIGLFSSTIFITMFLFFIDEGYYNFNWMTNIGSWIVFYVYAMAIFLGQLITLKVLDKIYQKPGKLLLTILGGTTIGILFVIKVIFTN